MTTECCMCGDYGLSDELFICKICQFRSQHRYCSNLYPKAESYRVCNWCLSQKDDAAEKTQNSSDSSPSNRSSGAGDDDHSIRSRRKKNAGEDLKGRREALRQLLQIKKQRSPEGSPPSAGRGRIVAGGGGLAERLRRTKSEEIWSGGGIKKHVFRNKVRRYKLLDEVSS
ncbi:hypothetical protein NMG60_11031366 [Bertholletia excelsa]